MTRAGSSVAALMVLLGAATPARADGLTDPVRRKIAQADEPGFFPILRVSSGPAIHVAPSDERNLRAALDVAAGVTFNPTGIVREHAGVYYAAEIGYAYDRIGAHAFSVGPAIGYGDSAVYVLYHPRFLIGGAFGDTLYGVRNGASVHVLLDLFSLEVAHQMFGASGALHHDVRVTAGFNVGMLAYTTVRLIQGLQSL